VLAEDHGIAFMHFGRVGKAITHCEVFGSAPTDYQRWLEAAVLRLPAHQFGVAFDLRQSGRTMSRILAPADYEAYRRDIAPFGLADLLAVFGVIDGRDIFGAYVPLARRRSEPAARTRKLRLLGVHVGTAYRARQRGASRDEAWFEPDGRLHDAVGDAVKARDTLREVVKRIDRARAGRVGEDATLELWTALVDGRWTLMDRFDTDGRRFVIARRNAPELGRYLALTPEESAVARLHAMGQSSKLVAYTLGISQSSVSRRLHDALFKLGMRSVADLIRAYQVLSDSPTPLESEP
jgi:DNA-binding CsgD family transcriptional regulator